MGHGWNGHGRERREKMGKGEMATEDHEWSTVGFHFPMEQHGILSMSTSISTTRSYAVPRSGRIIDT